jgi:hypothetical protein
MSIGPAIDRLPSNGGRPSDKHESFDDAAAAVE